MRKVEKRKVAAIVLTMLFGVSVISARPLQRTESIASKNPGKIIISMLEPQFSSASTPTSSPWASKEQKNEKNDVLFDQNSQSHPSLITDHLPREKSIGKELYLTFDDGPLKGTENVLNVLKKEKIPATMFCIGRNARLHPDLFRQELSIPALQIANHTYSHANGHYSRFYNNTFGVLSDVEHAQIVLGGRKYLRLAGRNVWRLPEVTRDDRAIIALRGSREVPKYNALSREGYFIYGWDVEWHFDHRSGHPVESPELLAARIEALYRHGQMAQRGKVVLLTHDFMFRSRHSTAELRRFIRLMKRRGWQFKTIRHYSRFTPEPLYVAKYYKKQSKTLLASAADLITPLSSSHHRTLTATKRHTGTKSSSFVSKPLSGSSVGHVLSSEALLSDAVRHYDALDVDRLIRQGARINRIDEFGRTPLNTAVRANSLFLVKKLLAYGADLTQKDGSGITPLQTARRFKRQAIEAYLIHCSRKYTDSFHWSRREEGRNTPVAIAQPIHINPLEILSRANKSNPFN